MVDDRTIRERQRVAESYPDKHPPDTLLEDEHETVAVYENEDETIRTTIYKLGPDNYGWLVEARQGEYRHVNGEVGIDTPKRAVKLAESSVDYGRLEMGAYGPEDVPDKTDHDPTPVKNRDYTCDEDDVQALDLFAGAGGLSAGLGRAGVCVEAAFDWNEDAVETYNQNFMHPAYQIDLSELDPAQAAEKFDLHQSYDLICGGPPCQGFSLMGDRSSDDERNEMVWEFYDWVEFFDPTCFMIENVAGLTSFDDGKVLEDILEYGRNLGYEMEYKELRASDYGVPQHRDRVFVIGHPGTFEWPEPTPERTPDVETTLNSIAETPNWLPNHDDFKADHGEKTQQKWWDAEHGDDIHDADTQFKLEPTDAGGTVYTSPNFHPFLPRKLTPREMAAIQSFHTEFTFTGSKTSQEKQVGNAVPPKLARHMGAQLEEAVTEAEETGVYAAQAEGGHENDVAKHGQVAPHELDSEWSQEKADAFAEAVEQGDIELGSGPLRGEGAKGIDKGLDAIAFDLYASGKPTKTGNLASSGTYPAASPHLGFEEGVDEQFIEEAAEAVDEKTPEGWEAVISEGNDPGRTIHVQLAGEERLVFRTNELIADVQDYADMYSPSVSSDPEEIEAWNDALLEYAGEVDIPDRYALPDADERHELDHALLGGVRTALQWESDRLTIEDAQAAHAERPVEERAVDEAKRAELLDPTDPADIRKWMKHPGQYDLKGVDTVNLENQSARANALVEAASEVDAIKIAQKHDDIESIKNARPLNKNEAALGFYNPSNRSFHFLDADFLDSYEEKSDNDDPINKFEFVLTHEAGHSIGEAIKIRGDSDADNIAEELVYASGADNNHDQPVKNELRDLSMERRAEYDPEKDTNRVKYREKPHELFADYIASLVIEPEYTKRNAPQAVAKTYKILSERSEYADGDRSADVLLDILNGTLVEEWNPENTMFRDRDYGVAGFLGADPDEATGYYSALSEMDRQHAVRVELQDGTETYGILIKNNTPATEGDDPKVSVGNTRSTVVAPTPEYDGRVAWQGNAFAGDSTTPVNHIELLSEDTEAELSRRTLAVADNGDEVHLGHTTYTYRGGYTDADQLDDDWSIDSDIHPEWQEIHHLAKDSMTGESIVWAVVLDDGVVYKGRNNSPAYPTVTADEKNPSFAYPSPFVDGDMMERVEEVEEGTTQAHIGDEGSHGGVPIDTDNFVTEFGDFTVSEKDLHNKAISYKKSASDSYTTILVNLFYGSDEYGADTPWIVTVEKNKYGSNEVASHEGLSFEAAVDTMTSELGKRTGGSFSYADKSVWEEPEEFTLYHNDIFEHVTTGDVYHITALNKEDNTVAFAQRGGHGSTDTVEAVREAVDQSEVGMYEFVGGGDERDEIGTIEVKEAPDR